MEDNVNTDQSESREVTSNNDDLQDDSVENSEQKIKQDEITTEKTSTPVTVSSGIGRSSAKTPESDNIMLQPKSISSGDLIFEAKRKKKKSPSTDPDSYEVTFVVTIAMAIPSAVVKDTDDLDNPSPVEDELNQDVKDLMRRKKRVFEAPRAQSYYHIEYCIVPDEDELMKTDCVTYGVAAKLYMERQDPRVIKTWQEGMVTWVAWANSHTITMNKEMLLKLFNHSLELRVWDTKDKVSTRARFDRPKAFRLPHPKPGESADDVGGVKSMVLKQSRSFIRIQPKKGPAVRPLPTSITYPKSVTASARRRQFMEAAEDDLPFEDQAIRLSPDTSIAVHSDKLHSPISPVSAVSPTDAERISPTPQTLVAVPNPDSQQQDGRTFSRLGQLAGATRAVSSATKETKSQKSLHDRHPIKTRTTSQMSAVSRVNNNASSISNVHKSGGAIQSSASDVLSGTGPRHSSLESTSKHKRNKKVEAMAQEVAEEIRKIGICRIPIQMSLLFSDMKSVTGRLDHAVPGVEDMFITVSLDGPLMSEDIKQELNPMIIKIHAASELPDTPMSYNALKSKCHPVYCKYTFYKQPEHISIGKEHNHTVYWDDTNVVLLGHMDKSELREYLNGPALEIEVHDRDRKSEEVKLKATLFGDDLEDEKISNVGTVASRRTVHNPFHGRNKPWDPFGVAKINLSELLLGHRYLHLKVPIHSCPIPDVLGTESNKNGRIMGVTGAVDGPVEKPLPAGHFLKSNSMLKIKIELAVPLVTPEKIKSKEDLETTFECPFGRIVYIFDYHNTATLNKLQQIITNINSVALDLKDMPQHVINAALSTYKLSMEQQESRDLDIITGFQVMDGTHHIFVLEGLRDRALKLIWNSVKKEESSDIKVLYNSDMCFSVRLYRALDVDLCRVKLHEPLSMIVQQSLLYVRDMVPKLCFQALVRLQQLSNLNKLRDATRNDLFPTAEMVISMSREFGIPFTAEDFDELRPDSQLKKSSAPTTRGLTTLGTSRNWTPIDNNNSDYITMLADKEGTQPTINFIQDNKIAIESQSNMNRRKKEKTQVLTLCADVTTAHNYSTQSFNSTDLGKDKMRKALSANPDQRYTYCQDYHHSMTVVPVNVEELKQAAKEESKSQWQTAAGWIYPGMKSMLESNHHPNLPGDARRLSLTQPWKENILHVNQLQSTLGRDRFPWDYRRYDLDLYRQSLPYFSQPEPITIHLAGEKLQQEKQTVKQKEQETWKSKIVVSDTRPYYHRCLPETELRKSGIKSSNQLDRLCGLLKDKPEKYSLRQPGFITRPIPPLDVVLNPKVDTLARLEGKILELACPEEQKEFNKGYTPGPMGQRSLRLENNLIPSQDYEHSKFRRLKGNDFNVYHTQRQTVYQKQIQPLEDEDIDNHLFRIPYNPDIHGPLDIPVEFQLGKTEFPAVNRSGLLKPMILNSDHSKLSLLQQNMEQVT